MNYDYQAGPENQETFWPECRHESVTEQEITSGTGVGLDGYRERWTETFVVCRDCGEVLE